MSRFARTRRVFFIEEPVFEPVEPHLRTTICPASGVHVETPVLPPGLSRDQTVRCQRELLQSLVDCNKIADYVLWYYTPMAREFSSWLQPQATVYDCMDELSAFAGAPPAMRANEFALFQVADLVFTGGASLFESKRKQHDSVHLFPSSVDTAHFRRARMKLEEPKDQAGLPWPRLGYAGVIDERMDLLLLREIANARPDWQFVLLGPVVKINPASLPQAQNIHYLGLKPYADLPAYFSGWRMGLLPFVLNESTRFISPTKTPEYLAAGLPVISTAIHDVVAPYGDLGLVEVARSPSEFLGAADALLKSPPAADFWKKADKFLSQSSWDQTWSKMNRLIDNTVSERDRAIKAYAQSRAITRETAQSVANV